MSVLTVSACAWGTHSRVVHHREKRAARASTITFQLRSRHALRVVRTWRDSITCAVRVDRTRVAHGVVSGTALDTLVIGTGASQHIRSGLTVCAVITHNVLNVSAHVLHVLIIGTR